MSGCLSDNKWQFVMQAQIQLVGVHFYNDQTNPVWVKAAKITPSNCVTDFETAANCGPK